jgi:hypothetical protein
MKVNIKTSIPDLNVDSIGKDVVVFITTASHLDFYELAIIRICEITKKYKKNNAVLINNCAGADPINPDPLWSAAAALRGIHLICLQAHAAELASINKNLDPNFKLEVGHWNQAKHLSLFFSHLAALAHKIEDIQDRINKEEELLGRFPFVGKLEALEFHPAVTANALLLGDDLIRLFALPSKLECDVNAVVLLDEQVLHGVVMTKAQKIQFTVIWPEDEYDQNRMKNKIINGGFAKNIEYLRIQFSEATAQIFLHLAKGTWWIQPHPQLALSDPLLRYIPTWQRLRAGNIRTIIFYHNSTSEGRKVEKFLKENDYALRNKGYRVTTVFSTGDNRPKIITAYKGAEGVNEIQNLIRDILF